MVSHDDRNKQQSHHLVDLFVSVIDKNNPDRGELVHTECPLYPKDGRRRSHYGSLPNSRFS